MRYIWLVLLLSSCQSSLTDKELDNKYLDAFENRNWKGAIEYLDEKIERNPKDAYAYYAWAVATSNQRTRTDIVQMINDLDISLQLDNKNEQALFLRFQAKLFDLNFKEAAEDINSLIERKGELPFLLSWKGNCAFAAKEFKEAELTYEKRLKLGGQYADMKNTYYYWIFSKYFSGNKEGAIWDGAFLESRGFKPDKELQNALEEDKLNWKELANFPMLEMTIEQLDELLNET
ncbi:MAG: hypothetical protein AB8G86_01770 [Saprospiraceae bacterium]